MSGQADTRIVLAHCPPISIPPLTIVPALRQVVHSDGRDEILEPKVMEVLVALLAAHGAILTRDELCEAAWDGRVVGDDAINRVLARIRRLSEGLAAGVLRLETITKVGYRLLVTAEAMSADPVPVAAAPDATVPPPLSPRPDTAATAPIAAVPVPPPVPPPTVAAARDRVVVDRRVLIGGGAVLVAAGGLAGWQILRAHRAAGDSIAVLPFANLSGDPAQAYFSDGLAEELRSALTRIVRLKVAARTSSELMRNADVPTAAAKLGVANVLTGSVRRGAGTIRVSAQLNDGSSGLALWSDSYDRPAGDVLQVQTNIATSVAGALNIALGHVERALLAAGGTTVAAAHDAYLRGMALAAEQKRPLALAAFDAAVDADPNYALAHAARASVMASIAINDSDTPTRAGLYAAEAEARRAIALAPGVGAPIAELGYVRQNLLDLPGAAAAFAEAYRRGPGDATVLWRCAVFQALVGQADAALRLMAASRRLDPEARGGVIGGTYVLLHTGHIDAAIAGMRRKLAAEPDHPGALEQIGYALVAAGRPAEAIAATSQLPAGGWPRLTVEAMAQARLGNRAASDRALAALRREDDVQYQLAQVYAQRGEANEAFAALNRALDLRDSGLVAMKTDPLLAPISGDPRFATMLRRLGFAAAAAVKLG